MKPRFLRSSVGTALLALAAACGSPAKPPEATAAPPPTIQRSPASKQTINGLPFFYESYGEGFPVVVIHGASDRSSVVPRLEPVFAGAKGWQRIYPDLPGAGATPARPSIKDVDGYIAELHALLDAVLPGKRFALGGFSWGGYVALAYAQRHPERVAGLGLFVPALAGADGERPKPKVLVEEPGVLDGLPPEAAEMLGGVATVHTRAVIDAIRRDVLPGVRSLDEGFLNRVARTKPPNAGDVRAFMYDGPALLITGRQDPMTGYVEARMLAERLPRATYAVLDRAGHALAIEQADVFRALVNEWLGRVREASGEPYQKPTP